MDALLLQCGALLLFDNHHSIQADAELIGKQRDDTKHQVLGYLAVPLGILLGISVTKDWQFLDGFLSGLLNLTIKARIKSLVVG